MSGNDFAAQLAEINESFCSALKEKSISERTESTEPNVFEILGIQNREVLVCRVLGDALDPNGKLNNGNTAPLKLFLDEVLKVDREYGEHEMNDAEIVLEEVTDENRRVDIVIKIGGEIYPLEVKINAVDQRAQLYDYYRFYFGDRPDKTIYYLTPTGKAPSADSIRTLNRENCRSISFDTDILSWLRKLSDSCEFNDTARFIIKQFEEVIRKMTLDLKTRDALYEAFGYTESGGFRHGELLTAILNNHDEIKALMQRTYIGNNNDLENEPYILTDNVTKEDKKRDSHVLLKVLDQNGNALAWISVATYLYIATDNEKVKERPGSEWVEDKTGAYYWRHLFLKGEREKLQLSNPKNCLNKNGNIAIKDALKDCE